MARLGTQVRRAPVSGQSKRGINRQKRNKILIKIWNKIPTTMDGYDSGYDSETEFDYRDMIDGDYDDVPLDELLAGL